MAETATRAQRCSGPACIDTGQLWHKSPAGFPEMRPNIPLTRAAEGQERRTARSAAPSPRRDVDAERELLLLLTHQHEVGGTAAKGDRSGHHTPHYQSRAIKMCAKMAAR